MPGGIFTTRRSPFTELVLIPALYPPWRIGMFDPLLKNFRGNSSTAMRLRPSIADGIIMVLRDLEIIDQRQLFFPSETSATASVASRSETMRSPLLEPTNLPFPSPCPRRRTDARSSRSTSASGLPARRSVESGDARSRAAEQLAHRTPVHLAGEAVARRDQIADRYLLDRPAAERRLDRRPRLEGREVRDRATGRRR